MRLRSWLALGQKLSAIRHAIHDGEHVVRGTIDDLSYRRGDSFSVGCETDDAESNRLSVTSLADLSLIKEWERTCAHHPNARVMIWSLDSDLGGYDRAAG